MTGSGRGSAKSSGKGSGKGSGRNTPNRAKHKEEELQKQLNEKLRLEKEAEKARFLKENKKRLEEERVQMLAALKPSEEESSQLQLNKMLSHIEKTFQQEKYDYEFERFSRAGKRPDPLEVVAISTYKSLLNEYGGSSTTEVFEDIRLMLSLLNELDVMNRKYSQNVDEQVMNHRYKNISKLENLIAKRYNDATLKILQEAVFLVESESGNLEKVYKGGFEKILIWGNLARNPRITFLEFPEEGIKIDYPATIAVADIGVRILITSFDHVSDKCSTFYPKRESDSPVIKENGETEAEIDHVEEHMKEEPGVEGHPPEEVKPEPEKQEQKIEESNPTEASSVVEGAASVGEKGTGTVNEETEEKVDHETEKEKSVIDDPDMLDPDVVDLRQYMRLGGIYNFEMFKMPPQSIVVNGWTLTQVLDEPLTNLTYPEDVIIKEVPKPPSEKSGDYSEEEEEEEEDEEKEEDDEEGEKEEEVPEGEKTPEPTPTIGVTMPIPENVMFYEEPQMAKWDEEDKHWKTSGITDVVYDDENKTIAFQIDGFGKFCLLQDTHLNMPFQTWELRATSNNSALFTVIAACSENIFEIKGTSCRLLKPEEGPTEEFAFIYEKWMEPEELIKLMKSVGNNIFPSEDSVNFVSVEQKEIDCNMIYDQMAYLAPSFAFAWSRFSNDVRDNELILQVIPIIEPTEKHVNIVEDERAGTFVVKPDRCHKVASTEQEIRLNYEIADDCPCHTDLLHAVKMTPLSQDAGGKLLSSLNTRVDNGDLELVATVRYFLRATNVLQFS